MKPAPAAGRAGLAGPLVHALPGVADAPVADAPSRQTPVWEAFLVLCQLQCLGNHFRSPPVLAPRGASRPGLAPSIGPTPLGRCVDWGFGSSGPGLLGRERGSAGIATSPRAAFGSAASSPSSCCNLTYGAFPATAVSPTFPAAIVHASFPQPKPPRQLPAGSRGPSDRARSERRPSRLLFAAGPSPL